LTAEWREKNLLSRPLKYLPPHAPLTLPMRTP